MLTHREDVVKYITFDVNIPIDTVFNNAKKLGGIATTALNPYTDQQYINLAYNILNKTARYKIGLWE